MWPLTEVMAQLRVVNKGKPRETQTLVKFFNAEDCEKKKWGDSLSCSRKIPVAVVTEVSI